MSAAALAAALAIAPALAGPGGQALVFDGGTDETGDYVIVPHDAALSLGALTVEAWVKVGGGADFDRRPIVSKGENFGNYTLAVLGSGSGYPTGTLEFQFDGAEGGDIYCRSDETSVGLGAWTHVAATYDPSTGNAALFINGEPVNTSGGCSTYFSPPNTNAEPLYIGRAVFTGEGTYSQYFRGEIDEVRLWNVARSAEDLLANYNQIIDGATPYLVGYWNFDEPEICESEGCVGNQNVYDLAALGGLNDGTLGGDTGVFDDDPERTPSAIPSAPGLALCPLSSPTLDALKAAAPGAYFVLNNVAPPTPSTLGPAICTGTGGGALTAKICDPDPNAANSCFQTDGPVTAVGTFAQEIMNVVGSTCTVQCFPVSGKRICQSICIN